MEAGSRALYYLGAAIPSMVEQETNAFSQLAYGQKAIQPSADTALPPARTIPQHVADFAGNVLPYMGVVASGSGAMRSAVGGASMLSKALTGASGFGFAGASEGRDVGLEQAAEGAVLGPIEMLPRVQRILPAAALATGSREFFNDKYPQPVVGDFTAGDIAGAANFVLPMLPGVMKADARAPHNAPHTPSIAPTSRAVNPWTTAARIPAEAPIQPTGSPAFESYLGVNAPQPGAAEASFQAMEADRLRRLQVLQTSGLMPLDQPQLSPNELRIKQNLALGNIEPPQGPMPPNPWVSGTVSRDPNAPIPLGFDPAHISPEPISPSAIVPYQGGEAQQSVRMQSPLYSALGIGESRTPTDFATNAMLENQKPNQALMMAMIGHEVNQEELSRKLDFANYSGSLDTLPANTILPGSDPWAEMLKAGGSRASDPAMEKTVEGLRRLGGVSRDPASTVRQELNHYLPEERAALQQHLGTTDSEPETLAQVIVRRAPFQEAETPTPFGKSEPSLGGRGHPNLDIPDQSAQINRDLLNALGAGTVRAGIGATAGGLFAANDNNPDTDPLNWMLGGALAGAAGPIVARRGIGQMERLAKVFRDAGSESGAIGGTGRRPVGQLALRLSNGEIITGTDARAHMDLYSNLPDHAFDGGDPEHGFVRADGTWMNREQAHDYASKLSPEYAAWAAKNGVTELHSQGVVSPDLQLLQNNSVGGKMLAGKLPDWMQEGLAERRAKGWDDKWPFVPADLQNQGFREAIQADPELSIEEKKRILSFGQGMKKGGNEAGVISDEMRQALGRASVGAVVGMAAGNAVDDPGSHDAMLAGLTVGALSFAFGPSLVRALVKERTINPTTPKVATSFDLQDMIAKAKLQTFQKGINASSIDRVMDWADTQLGLSKDETLKRILGDARGAPAVFMDKLESSFRQVQDFNVGKEVEDATNSFLAGKTNADEYKTAINASSSSKLDTYANFAIVARQAMNGMQDVATRGVGPKKAAIISDSIGKYVRQSYKLFLTKHSPSEGSIQNLAAKIVEDKLWGDDKSISHVSESLRQWAQEVQKVKGMYHGASSAEGKSIDSTLFIHRKVLDKEMREFLGEITNPVERVNLTLLKLRPLAEASDFMSQVAKGTKTEEGLPHMFADRNERDVLRKQIEALPNGTEGKQRKLDELGQYYFVDNSPRNGDLGGKLVHRTIYDVLNEWDDAHRVDSAFGRAMLGLNTMMKKNVTYRNPLSIVRQIVTAPFFMQIGRADYGNVGEALNAIQDSSHPLRQELVQRGIVNVDAISRDVYRELDTLSSGMMAASRAGSNDASKAWLGRLDNKFATVANTGNKYDTKLADWFRTPDNVVRVATYLTAKTRIAKQLGLALEDPIVANKAVEFTNRYTMNYEHLPRAVKAGRSVPGVNLFLSYTSEIVRLMKNMGEDMVKGDKVGGDGARMNAVKAMGALVALPATLEAIGNNNLSEKDSADWETTKKNLPGYARHRFYFVTGRDPKTKQFHYIDYTSLVPIDAFSQTVRALASGDASAAAQVNPIFGLDNNPGVNIAASLITQQNIHTGVKSRGLADNVSNISQEIGGPLTPGTGSVWRYLKQATTTNAEGELGVTDKNGRTLTPADLIPWAAGIRSGTYSLEAQQARAIADYKSQVADETYYLNQVLKSNTNQEEKDRAKERAKQAIIALQRQVAEKLGIKRTES